MSTTSAADRTFKRLDSIDSAKVSEEKEKHYETYRDDYCKSYYGSTSTINREYRERITAFRTKAVWATSRVWVVDYCRSRGELTTNGPFTSKDDLFKFILTSTGTPRTSRVVFMDGVSDWGAAIIGNDCKVPLNFFLNSADEYVQIKCDDDSDSCMLSLDNAQVMQQSDSEGKSMHFEALGTSEIRVTRAHIYFNSIPAQGLNVAVVMCPETYPDLGGTLVDHLLKDPVRRERLCHDIHWLVWDVFHVLNDWKRVLEYCGRQFSIENERARRPNMRVAEDLHQETSVHIELQELLRVQLTTIDAFVKTIGSEYAATMPVLKVTQLNKSLQRHQEFLKILSNLTDNLTKQVYSTMTVRESVSIGKLTWITLIFLPLNFAASIFSMNIVEINRHEPTMVVYIILTVSLLFATLVVPFGGDLIRQKIVQGYRSRRSSEIWDMEQRSSLDGSAPRKYSLGAPPESPRIQPIGAQLSPEYYNSGATSQPLTELGYPRQEEPPAEALLGGHVTSAFVRPTVKAIDLAVALGQEARFRDSCDTGEASTTASIRSAQTRVAEDEQESPLSDSFPGPFPIHPPERENSSFEHPRDASPSRESTSARVPGYPSTSAGGASVEKSQTLVRGVVDKVFHGTRTGEGTKDDSSGWRKGKISMQRRTSLLRAKLQAQQRARSERCRGARGRSVLGVPGGIRGSATTRSRSPEATSTRGETLVTELPESGIGFETPKNAPRLRLLYLLKNGPSAALETKKFWVPRKEIATWKKLKSVVVETVRECFPEAYDNAESGGYEVSLKDAVVLERFWETEINDPALVQEPVYIRVNNPQNAVGSPVVPGAHDTLLPLSRTNSLPELGAGRYERVGHPADSRGGNRLTSELQNPTLSPTRRTSEPQNLTFTSASRDLSRADSSGDYLIAISGLGHPRSRTRRSSMHMASTGRLFKLKRSNTDNSPPAPGAATSLINPGAGYVFI